MKNLGAWLIAIGSGIVLIAFCIGNTVSAEVPDLSLSSLTGSILTRHQEVANLPKLQLQTMIFQSGIAVFLAGAIFVGCGAILETLTPPQPLDATAPSPSMAPSELPASANEEAGAPDMADGEPEPDGYGWVFIVVGGLLAVLLIFAIATSQQNSADVRPAATNTTEVVPAENIQSESDRQATSKSKRHR